MAALKQRINDDLKSALLGGDRFVAETLRGLKAAILNEEVAKGAREAGLDDATIETVVAREIKKRMESALIYRDSDRPELAEPEEREAEILRSFLPEQLSDAELQKVIDSKIKQLDVTDMSMMGRVIGAVKAEVGTRADGATVADMVKKTLES